MRIALWRWKAPQYHIWKASVFPWCGAHFEVTYIDVAFRRSRPCKWAAWGRHEQLRQTHEERFVAS